MRRLLTHRAWRGLLLAAMACGVGPLLWWLAPAPNPARVARYLERRLAKASDSEVPSLVQQLEGLDLAGIAPLARAVGAPRSRVALAAQTALADQLARWQATYAQREQVAPLAVRYERLAEALAMYVHLYGPHAQREAARMALAMLAEGTRLREEVALSWVQHCDAILRITGTPSRVMLTPQELLAIRNSPASGDAELMNPAAVMTSLSPVPGGGIPLPFSETEAVAPHTAAPAVAVANEPSQPPVDAQAYPIYARRSFDARWQRPQVGARPSPAEDTPGTEGPPKPEQTIDIPSPQVMERHDRELVEMPLRKVMRLLHHDDRFVVRGAEYELGQRGMTAVHIELARLLTDSDATVRRQLVEQLPRISGVDARPWLLWLIEDEDAETRLAALTLLATAGDPLILQQVRAVALRDADPRITQLAERLATIQSDE